MVLLYWIVWAIVAGVIGRGSSGQSPWMGGPAVTRSGGFDKDSALGKMEEWGRNVEEAGRRAGADSSRQALSTEQLKTFIPETLAGLPRTWLAAKRNAALGFQVSEANAQYGDDQERSLRLSLNDTGVEQERSWDTGIA